MGGDPVIVFAGSLIEAGLVKSLLEAAGIRVALLNEAMGTLEPWVVDPGGVSAVKVMVPAGQADEAIRIVRGYEENRA